MIKIVTNAIIDKILKPTTFKSYVNSSNTLPFKKYDEVNEATQINNDISDVIKFRSLAKLIK